MVGDFRDVITCAEFSRVPSFKLKSSWVTILQGVELSIFLSILAWALQQCSANALPVISVVVVVVVVVMCIIIIIIIIIIITKYNEIIDVLHKILLNAFSKRLLISSTGACCFHVKYGILLPIREPEDQTRPPRQASRQCTQGKVPISRLVSYSAVCCSSRMRVMNHNWSATKQRLHPQSVAEISRHSVLSGDRIRQCGTSSGSRYKDTDQCL